MGYESRLFIVNKSSLKPMECDNGKFFAEKIAEFNLCKTEDFSTWFCKQPETDCFIFADDGNTQIFEDKYGDALKEASVKDVIEELEFCMSIENYYRRYYPILALLRAFRDRESDWQNLAVLHYGY